MIALITCLTAVFLGLAASTGTLGFHFENPEITLTLPAAELEPRLASLAGVWDAELPESVPSRVVVEKVTETWATVLYAWPDQQKSYPGGMWHRTRARVLAGGQLSWGYPVRFSLRATEGFGTLEITKAATDHRLTWELKKVGAFIATADIKR
jgi:hypothetical protein